MQLITLFFVAVLLAASIRTSFYVYQRLEKIYPVNKGSTVLITDAAHGFARELALHLAHSGFHVLAGVRTESEARSFIFDSRKGLEPVLFDINEPALIAKVIYRIKQVRLELDRPLSGLILNIADLYSDVNTTSHIGIKNDLLDAHFKTIYKASTKLLQPLVDIIVGTSDLELQRERKRNDNSRNGGGRILFLTSSDYQISYGGCGSLCLVQASLGSLQTQLRRDLSSHNLSVSEVVLPSVVSSGAGRGGSGAGSSGRARRQTDVMQEVHKRQKWAIDINEAGGSSEEAASENISPPVEAALHAILAPQPQALYDTAGPIYKVQFPNPVRFFLRTQIVERIFPTESTCSGGNSGALPYSTANTCSARVGDGTEGDYYEVHLSLTFMKWLLAVLPPYLGDQLLAVSWLHRL